MRKKINHLLLIIFLITLALIGTRFFLTLAFSYQKNAFNKDHEQKMLPHLPVMQTFLAEENNLSHLRVAIKDFPKKMSDVIYLEIADENCEQVIATSKIAFLSIRWTNYYDFRFSPLTNSAGKTYCAKLTFSPKENRKKDLPKIHASEGAAFSEISIINQGDTKKRPAIVGQTLIMKPAYTHDHWWQNLAELNERVSQYKPVFFKESLLGLIIILSVVTMIFVTVVFIILL